MTLTCWTTAAFPPFLHSVVCDSMDHWFAPVKRRSELGFSCLLHCSTSHAIITVHQSLTMLNVYLLWATARQTWCCCRHKVCRFQARQHLIWGLISFIIRCSGCFHVLWHSSATDAAEVTYRLLHGERHRYFSTSCGFQALYGEESWRLLRVDFFKSELVLTEQFNVFVNVLFILKCKWRDVYLWLMRWHIPDVFLLSGWQDACIEGKSEGISPPKVIWRLHLLVLVPKLLVDLIN